MTPARDEAENLPRLASSLLSQTVRPTRWVIVDSGSTDETLEIARDLASGHRWIQAVALVGEPVATRGAPVVRAIHAGVRALGQTGVDVCVVANADVSMAPNYFERLLAAFDAEPRLGMASGSRYEREGGVWRQRHVTGSSVEAQCRAYRWICLMDVLPLEERLCWDGIDEIKANVLGWKTRTLRDLPFRHHREIGARERRRMRAWRMQGEGAWYMGYRPSYIGLRTVHHARRDVRAFGMLFGYAKSALSRQARHPNPDVRAYVRQQQRFSHLPSRVFEALGHPRLFGGHAQ